MEEKLKNQIIVLIIGVLIGASGYLANSLILWNASVDKEKSDIAEGIYLDVSSLEDILVSTDRLLLDQDDKYVFIQSDPFYTSDGLYFAYQRDIPRMDRQVANDTFSFYNHLLLAERDRGSIYEIQRRGDLRLITPLELNQQYILTKKVAYEVNKSVGLLNILQDELGK